MDGMSPNSDYMLVLIRTAAAAICSILCKLALARWLLASGQGSLRLGSLDLCFILILQRFIELSVFI